MSEDEVSDLAVNEEVDAPVKKTTKSKSPKPVESVEDSVEDEKVENEDAEAEEDEDDDEEAGEGE